MQTLKPDRLSQTLPSTTTEASPRRDPRLNRGTTKSWSHLVAGACAGLVTATATSPLDVLRTRLQTDFYEVRPTTSRAPSSSNVNTALHHVRDTFRILSSIRHVEGWRGFFRGIGPSLTGVVPASAVKFYTYGNCKRLLCELEFEPDTVAVHAISASTAGILTGIATNPIWLIKTRLQLDKSRVGNTGGRYRNSLDCAAQVLRREGVKGLYRGLSASFLGAAETTLHLVLYERLKILFAQQEKIADHNGQYKTSPGRAGDWVGVSAAAGASKFIAALVAYPHEVVRTRLRQAPMENGSLKYTNLVQCFRLTWKEGRFTSLYSGLTPHILRAVPSAAITLVVYELVLKLLGEPT